MGLKCWFWGGAEPVLAMGLYTPNKNTLNSEECICFTESSYCGHSAEVPSSQVPHPTNLQQNLGLRAARVGFQRQGSTNPSKFGLFLNRKEAPGLKSLWCSGSPRHGRHGLFAGVWGCC